MALTHHIDKSFVGDENQGEIKIYAGGNIDYTVKNFRSGPYLNDGYDVELCTNGSFTLYLNDVPHEISAGMLYIIPPYNKAVRHFHEDGTTTSYVVVKDFTFKKQIDALGFSDTNVIFPYPLSQLCKDSFINLVNSLEIIDSFKAYSLVDEPEIHFIANENYSNFFSLEAELRQRSYFSLFLTELMHIKGINSGQSAEKSIQQEYINSAISYIETNHTWSISVDGIAKHIGINRSYLFKLFREELGMSVQEYIVHTRMKTACKLLRHPNAQINVVASSLGYEVCSFSRIFKKTVGMSPMEYRKKHQNNDW